MTTMPSTDYAGYVMVIERRMEALKDAIEAAYIPDAGARHDIEYGFDQVDRAVSKLREVAR